MLCVIFEYQDENDIVIESKTGITLFSNYVENGNKTADYPVPKAYNWGQIKPPDNEIHLGMDGKLYEIQFFHNGFIQLIYRLNN